MALASYKYADDPTVYRASDNYAFHTGDEFLQAGGDWNAIQTRQRPIQGSAPQLQGSSPALQPATSPRALQGPVAPPSAVATSQPARTATTKNLTSLSVTEAALSPEQSANNLSQVYQGRTDLQGLYNPDGTAKNPNDPRVAGIPTLADWAAKYGKGEESLLKGFSSSPAVNAMLLQINQGLSNTTRSGAPLGPETKQNISDVNRLTNEELDATARARAAAEDEDYRSLDTYMKELSQIRKNRDSLVSQLLKSVQKSDEELKLGGELMALDQEAKETKLAYKGAYNRANDKAIPMEMIRGQQESALRAANLQLERIATEQGPIINRLTLAQETRMNAVEALKIGIQAIDQDSDMVFKLASFANELAKTEKAEREAARDFAVEHNITTPWYNLAGTVYKSDGTKAYSTEETFYTDAGVTSFQEAYDRGLLIDVKPTEEGKEYQFQEINGIPYVFDKTTGQLHRAEGFDGYTPEDPDQNKVLTPEQAKLLGVPYGTTQGEAADMGITPQAPLSAEAQKLQANIASGLRALGTVKTELFEGATADTPIDELNNVRSNVLQRAALPFKFAGTYTNAEREIKDVLVRMRTGAAISAEEEAYYQKQLPNIWDNEETIKNKLRVFEDLFKSIAQGASGGTTKDLFEEFESGVSPTSFRAPSDSRTDRHLNPTAMTTAVAKSMGLVEGTDYVRGDSFSSGSGTLYTARFLSDPVATTIKAIDTGGFYTSSGKQRWTHTAIPQTQWSKLTYQQKVAVVDQMYKRENGGSSSLSNFYA